VLANISDLLRQTYVFSRIDGEHQVPLGRAFSEEHFHPGDIVIRRGQRADGWHIVIAGKARVVDGAAEAGPLPTLIAAGETFGDSSLLEPLVWPFTLRAESPLTVATLSPEAFAAFQRLVGPALADELASRVRSNAEFEFLKRVRSFARLPADRVEALLEEVTRATYPRGSYIFREDDPSDCCYVVRSGRIHLLKAVGQSQKQLTLRRDGDLLGEIELLFGTPRIAAAVASTDVELLVLSREVFDRCLPEGPTRDAIFQVATERLLQYQNMLAEGEAQEPWRIPSLAAERVRVHGRFSRNYPSVKRDSAQVAGLACLAMIDAVHHRESRWQDRLETLLWDQRAQTLGVFSRIAEECGYFTRLITLGPSALPSAELPAVIEDDDRSIAVIFEATRQSVTVGNPARGIRIVDAADFQRWWNGRILSISAPLPEKQALPVGGHIGSLTSIALASLSMLIFALAGPMAAKAIVDRVLVNNDMSLLRLLLVAVAAIVGFQLVATVLRDFLMAHVRHRATFSLQQRFLHHVLHLPQRILITKPVAALAVRFRDNEALVQSSSSAALTLVVDGLAVILYFAVLWTISPPAAAIAAVFVAGYAAVSIAASAIARGVGRRGHDARSALHAHLLETVAGIQTIKSLLVESTFFKRGRALMTRVKAAEFAASRVAFTTELIGSSLHVAAVVAIFGYGARLAATGRATTGDMVASLGIFGATLAPLTGLLDVRKSLSDARHARSGLAEISSLEVEAGSTAGVPPPIEGHIVFTHVNFRYPGQASDVLSDINLEILPGQTVAIIGRSGSGKTTLMNLLMGLYAPSSGNIYIDHIDIQSIPRVAYRHQLGVVEQQPFLFDGTVRENIAKVDPALPLQEVEEAARVAGIHDFVTSLPFGYDTKIGERGTALSGGEKQRLMIARALVAKPRLLILDEATSAVDSGAESQIQQNIRRAAAGRTTFVIAHRLSTIRNADRIVVLDRGRIVETGTHAELLAAKRLYYYLSTRTV
jgi:ABC-type bacteriocin/lantibiotic exporter with double-glycine peptidase domain/CRP-like cAMP-binding protein